MSVNLDYKKASGVTRYLAALLAFVLLSLCPSALAATAGGQVTLAPSYKNTYTISTAAFATVASPTDIFEIYGSASKTVRILRITCNGTAAAGSTYPVFILRRSTVNTGGTSSTLTPQKLDTTSPSATCTAKSYTANPTTGTLVGTVVATQIANTVSSSPGVANLPIFDADKYGGAMVLRGTSDGCTVNLNGVTPPNGSNTLVITATVTEE